MPPRLSPQFFQRTFTTTARARATLSPPFSQPINPTQVPKLGRIGKLYLPTMALLAIGMLYIPERLLSSTPPPTPRTVTLDSANRKIGFAIQSALDEHNRSKQAMTQEDKNRLLLDAYGSRSSIEDIEHAFQQMESNAHMNHHDRMQEAYGERMSLRDVQRAMEVYEVM